MSRRDAAVRGLYWAAIPLLAVATYGPVLGVGFLSDDFVLLAQAQKGGLDLSVFVPQPHWFLYRPVGTLLVWGLGWQLWGYNPLPYHVVSLLLHAGVSLTLALWTWEATGRRGVGWMAGALFAVFPLHLEAVGWVAAQWDAWALLFGVMSLWLFTRWWRRGAGGEGDHRQARPGWFTNGPYVLCVPLYALAVFAKESLLLFLPMYAVSAWLVSSRFGGGEWRRLIVAMLPLAGALALNAGLRFFSWGHLGGYGRTVLDYSSLPSVFWDRLIEYARVLVAPINSARLGAVTPQAVGAITSVALLVGLVLWGRKARKLLLAAGAWTLLALAPVLGFGVVVADLQNNRLLYPAAAGYCVGVAGLLYVAMGSSRKAGQVVRGGMALALLLGIATSWLHLGAWHTAGRQVVGIEQELAQLIPSQDTPGESVWYVENMPDNYQGAYVLRLGLGAVRDFTRGTTTLPKVVPDATQAPLAASGQSNFAMRFMYDEAAAAFHVGYLAGISTGVEPPRTQGLGEGGMVWDFRGCTPDTLGAWRVDYAQATCKRGEGLLVEPEHADPQMWSNTPVEKPMPQGARFVRLRVALSFRGVGPFPGITQWYWPGIGGEMSESRSATLPIRSGSTPHVYWTFVPASDLAGTLPRLRFDPSTSSGSPVTVHWIAMDIVK